MSTPNLVTDRSNTRLADGYPVTVADRPAERAEALAGGADLVYMGRRSLAATECMAQNDDKQMVVDHGPADILVSAGITGTDASWLPPSLRANGLDPDNLIAPAERSYVSGEASHRRWKDIWAADQGPETIRSIHPTATVVDQLEREYLAARDRFTAFTYATRRVPF